MRRDLVAALDRAAEKPVTMISAPAGSGKTSLLRAWADRPGQDRRIAFMSVRPGQQDAQLFWLALLDAVRAAAGTEGAAEPPPVAPGFDGGAMVDKVLSEVAAAGGHFFLVIDDLHELGSAEATEQLTALLTHLPHGVHAIVATRHDLPLRLHRLRLTGELAEIRAAELRFTEAETRELLATCGVALPDEVAGLLHQRAEGWAAGLRLAVLSLAGHPDPERFVAEFSGSHRTVAEYLMAEMLERQPADVQRLLLRTSLLDRVNGELADLLTGATGSERILLDLEDANAFVVSLDPDRTWFRYHRLFADLLRLELRHTHPEAIPELHRLAARWFAEHAQTADAVRHLQAAGDWAEAARLLTDHTVSLTLDGQGGTVVALLRAFPAGAGEDSPELALVYANADLHQHRLAEAQAHLEIARSYAATTPPDRRPRLRTAIASLDLLLARLRGHFDAVFEQADALSSPAVGRSNTEVALAGDLRALALLNLGVTEAWSLRLAESERHLLEGAVLARGIGRPYLEVACRAHLGFVSGSQSFALVRQRCEEAIALAARYGWDAEPVIAPAQVALAGTLICTGEFGQGEQWLDRSRRVTRSDGEPGVRLLVRLISAMLPAARGQHREALAELTAAEQVQAHMVGRHGLSSRVTAWTMATQARLGMVDQARTRLAALDDRQAAAGEIRNAAAVIRLAEKDPIGARRELRSVLDGTAPVNSLLTPIEAHLLDALAWRELGDDRAVEAAVERALHLAEPDRMILPFATTGAWELLDALQHRTSHAALVSDILDAVHGDAPDRSAAGPIEKLSPSELRVLRYLPTNLTRPEIAAELSVSPNTVNTHIRRIYAKLGARDRSSAVQRGRELRLLSNGRT
ncbi:LuxR C-terminal-related transcriptional regulator [Streptomyces pseudovenezuelae]|uniref:LuxR C-terminal-related transcriptional regulator n=1 Tax=Streptomyces pseudovenezuelae TaxID=67350 RepID=UPI0024752869|nr:LuxR C-terminal-related transcriptional regulator [Streptomyces pseudovenezuelae]